MGATVRAVPLGLLHLVVLALWGGVVLAESVIELLPRWRPDLRRAGATLHYYVDVAVEAPLIVAVVATGVALLLRRPLTADLLPKVALGSAAVLANVVCIVFVVKRHRGGDEALRARSRVVLFTALAGVPCAAAAFVLGATRAGLWP